MIKTENEPQLIKHGLKHFPQLHKWNKEYIKNEFGDISCNFSFDARPVRSKNTTTYDNYIKTLSDQSYSFTRVHYNHQTDKIIDDIDFPNPFFSKKEIDKYIFFCGPSHSGALQHSHGPALNLMVSGKKKWILFDSTTEYGARLQAYYYNKYPSNTQWIDWFTKEYKQLKENSHVKIYEFIQEPGDIVFIPDKYNHSVFNMKDTIGIVIELL